MRKKIIIMSMILTIASCFVTGCGSKKDSSKDSGKNTASTMEETTTVKSVQEETVIVPSVVGTDEDTAKTVMLNNGFIPTVEKEYSDSVEAGKVSRTSIEANQTVPKNSPIVIYISKGPSSYVATNMKWSWSNCRSSFKDEWYINYYDCYIRDGILTIATKSDMYEHIISISGVIVTAVNDIPTTISCNVDDNSAYDTKPEDNSILNDVISFPIDSIKVETPSDIKSVTYDFSYMNGYNEMHTITLKVEFEWGDTPEKINIE